MIWTTGNGWLWHFSEVPSRLAHVRYRRQTGQHTLARNVTAFDPSATLAMHRRNDFDAGFDPYQRARLSR
jgi:hypothetical protein